MNTIFLPLPRQPVSAAAMNSSTIFNMCQKEQNTHAFEQKSKFSWSPLYLDQENITPLFLAPSRTPNLQHVFGAHLGLIKQ
jgi:hypothetical protein